MLRVKKSDTAIRFNLVSIRSSGMPVVILFIIIRTLDGGAYGSA